MTMTAAPLTDEEIILAARRLAKEFEIEEPRTLDEAKRLLGEETYR